MKILLGFRTEHTSSGNDRSWSTTTNDAIDIIIKGKEQVVRDYVKEMKENVVRSKELSEELESVSHSLNYAREYNQASLEKKYDELHKELDGLSTLSRYKTLLMIDGEEL